MRPERSVVKSCGDQVLFLNFGYVPIFLQNYYSLLAGGPRKEEKKEVQKGIRSSNKEDGMIRLNEGEDKTSSDVSSNGINKSSTQVQE